jgi:hypothetical protein
MQTYHLKSGLCIPQGGNKFDSSFREFGCVLRRRAGSICMIASSNVHSFEIKRSLTVILNPDSDTPGVRMMLNFEGTVMVSELCQMPVRSMFHN